MEYTSQSQMISITYDRLGKHVMYLHACASDPDTQKSTQRSFEIDYVIG